MVENVSWYPGLFSKAIFRVGQDFPLLLVFYRWGKFELKITDCVKTHRKPMSVLAAELHLL